MDCVGDCLIEKNDAGGGTLWFTSFGVSISVSYGGECPIAQLLLYLPPHRNSIKKGPVDRSYRISQSLSTVEGQSPGFCVCLGERILSDRVDLIAALAAFESDVSLAIATDSRHRSLFVHSGVVAFGEKAVLLPGTSRCGKSTLVTTLVAAGATYYSDEFAVIDSEGLVYPYLRQPSLRGGDPWAIGAKVPLDNLGGELGAEALRVGAVVACRYVKTAHWEGEVVMPGRGALLLLENAISAQLYPDHALKVLCGALEGAAVWEGIRGESEEAVKCIREWVDSLGMSA